MSGFQARLPDWAQIDAELAEVDLSDLWQERSSSRISAFSAFTSLSPTHFATRGAASNAMSLLTDVLAGLEPRQRAGLHLPLPHELRVGAMP